MIAPALSLCALCLTQGPILSLEQALAEAKAQNPDLQAAQARLTSAHELSAKVWSSYLPQISLATTYTRNSAAVAFAKIDIQKLNQLGAQAQFSQALLAPALWPALQAAYLGEEVAQLSVENAKREILFAVVQLYFGATALKEALQVQVRLLGYQREHEKDADNRFRAGTIPKLAVVRAQLDRVKAEQDVVRTETAYAAAKSALATLLSRPATDFEVEKPGLIAEQPTSSDRLDIQSAKKAVELATNNLDGTLFKYLPALGLSGLYRLSNVAGLTGQNESWVVLLGLNWTLWDGGLRESERRENLAQVREAQALLQATENRATDELTHALLEQKSTAANQVKADEQLKLAQESVALVKVSFEAGAATYLDFADASAALLGAELNKVTEDLNAQLVVLKIAKAAGTFNP